MKQRSKVPPLLDFRQQIPAPTSIEQSQCHACAHMVLYIYRLYIFPHGDADGNGTVSMVCINLRLTQLCVCLLRNRPVQFSRNRRGGGGTDAPKRRVRGSREGWASALELRPMNRSF